MKSNIHKKMTFEDRFDRKYACWANNLNRVWRYWKRQNRRQFRREANKIFIDGDGSV